jgi:hypothetical protein
VVCKERCRECRIGEKIDGIWVNVRYGVVVRLSQDGVKVLGEYTQGT